MKFLSALPSPSGPRRAMNFSREFSLFCVRARFLARFSSAAPFFFAALNEFGHKEK
jgi:hypothetical protein